MRETILQASCSEVLVLSGMANVSESLLSAVTVNKPKMLIGLNQKVCSQVIMLFTHYYVDAVLPVQRRGLTHLVRSRQQGKPVNFF